MTLHLNVIQLQNYIYWLDIFTYEYQRALEMATTRAQVERDAHCGLRSRVTDASIIHVMSRNSNCAAACLDFDYILLVLAVCVDHLASGLTVTLSD